MVGPRLVADGATTCSSWPSRGTGSSDAVYHSSAIVLPGGSCWSAHSRARTRVLGSSCWRLDRTIRATAGVDTTSTLLADSHQVNREGERHDAAEQHATVWKLRPTVHAGTIAAFARR